MTILDDLRDAIQSDNTERLCELLQPRPPQLSPNQVNAMTLNNLDRLSTNSLDVLMDVRSPSDDEAEGFQVSFIRRQSGWDAADLDLAEGARRGWFDRTSEVVRVLVEAGEYEAIDALYDGEVRSEFSAVFRHGSYVPAVDELYEDYTEELRSEAQNSDSLTLSYGLVEGAFQFNNDELLRRAIDVDRDEAKRAFREHILGPDRQLTVGPSVEKLHCRGLANFHYDNEFCELPTTEVVGFRHRDFAF